MCLSCGNRVGSGGRVCAIRTRLVDAVYWAIWALWTRTPLHRVGNATIERIPAGPRRWIERRKRDLRQREWWQPGLRQRLREGREIPLVSERELEDTYGDVLRLLAAAAGPGGVGDYLEFGVYVGTSLLCMHRASNTVGLGSLRLFGFDSFQGLPEAAATEDEGFWQAGWYRAELDLVRDHLTRSGIDWSRTVLVPGWFEDTLRPELAHRIGIEKAGVIFIDCDIYPSALTALRFCAPLIRDQAVVLFDNWNAGGLASKGLGERRAFEEFLAGNPELAAEKLETRASTGFLVTRTGT